MLLSTIRSKKVFEFVNKNGNVFRSKYFIFIFCRSNYVLRNGNVEIVHDTDDDTLNSCIKINDHFKYENILSIGLKVTKRSSGKAVMRNKIRRRIKHIFRSMKSEFLYDNVSDVITNVIIVTKFNAKSASFSQMFDDIKHVVKKYKRFLKK